MTPTLQSFYPQDLIKRIIKTLIQVKSEILKEEDDFLVTIAASDLESIATVQRTSRHSKNSVGYYIL